jgi:hypothetical protein
VQGGPRTTRRSGSRTASICRDDPRDLAPVGAFRIGVEQAQTGDQAFLVVHREHWFGGRKIGDIRIRRGGFRMSSLVASKHAPIISLPHFKNANDGLTAHFLQT